MKELIEQIRKHVEMNFNWTQFSTCERKNEKGQLELIINFSETGTIDKLKGREQELFKCPAMKFFDYRYLAIGPGKMNWVLTKKP